MKKVVFVVLIMFFMLALATTAFAAPTKPPHNPNGGSCNMWMEPGSWWAPGTGPGNANGVTPGERGMYNVHSGTNPAHGPQGPDDWYANGFTNMDLVTAAQCG